jgi:hypothetical protein
LVETDLGISGGGLFVTNYMNECRKFILDRVMPEDLQRLPEPDPEDIKTMLNIALGMAVARGFVVKLSGDPEGCVGFQVGDFEVVPRETEGGGEFP